MEKITWAEDATILDVVTMGIYTINDFPKIRFCGGITTIFGLGIITRK